MGAVFYRGAGWPQWKPLGIPGTHLPLKRGSWLTLRLLNYIRNGVSTLLVYRRGKINMCEMFGEYTRKV